MLDVSVLDAQSVGTRVVKLWIPFVVEIAVLVQIVCIAIVTKTVTETEFVSTSVFKSCRSHARTQVLYPIVSSKIKRILFSVCCNKSNIIGFLNIFLILQIMK